MGLIDWAARSVISTMPSQAVETRAAAGALPSPVQWTAPNMKMQADWDGKTAVNSAYAGNLYVNRALNATADAISGLPFRAGLDPSTPSEYSTPQYSKLAYLLSPSPGSPNPQWSPRQLWKYAVLQYLITGKWVWLKEFSPTTGQLIRLWPIPAQYVDPIPAAVPKDLRITQQTDYFVDYEYEVQGRIQKLGKKNVVYFWNPSQKDHLQAESPLQSAAGRIGLLQMLERYDLALMKNNAVPSTIVTTEPFARPEDRRKFRQQFVRSFSGYDNTGKTLFLEADPDEGPDGSTTNNVAGKISVERLGMTAEELQQNEKWEAAVEDVLVALGTPKSVLGSARGETFSNSGQEITNWWNEKLLPLKCDLEDQVNVRFAPTIGRHVGWFDTSNVKALQPVAPALTDLAAMGKADATPTGPVLTRDEIRSYLGHKPWAEVDHPADEVPEEPPALESEPDVAPEDDAEPATAQPDRSTDATRGVAESLVKLALAEQHAAIEERRTSRRGRKAENLAELFDEDWHAVRAARFLEPVVESLNVPASAVVALARRLAEDSGHRLRVAAEVTDAFADVEQRARSAADFLVRAARPVPLDHVGVVLEAIRVGKLTGPEAVELWEAQA